jgi:hypothetical protein
VDLTRPDVEAHVLERLYAGEALAHAADLNHSTVGCATLHLRLSLRH